MSKRAAAVGAALVLLGVAATALAAGALGSGASARTHGPKVGVTDLRYRPLAGTLRVEARAEDPAGDAPWVVRVWRTYDNRMACEQLGRLVGGVVGDVAADGRFQPLKLGQRTICSDQVFDRHQPIIQVASFLDDPLAGSPRPIRTVAWGLGGPAVTAVTVSGPGGAKTAPRSPRRAWVDVRGGDIPTYKLVTRIRYRDGTARTIDYGQSPRPYRDPVAGSIRVEARVKSPQGGPQWGLLSWRTKNGSTCSYTGRVLATDRVGSWSPDTAFFDYPVGEGGTCRPRGPIGRAQPFPFSFGWSFGSGALLTGFAHPDVAHVVVEGFGPRRELTPGVRGGVLAVFPRLPGRHRLQVSVRFKDGSERRVASMPIPALGRRVPHGASLSKITPKVVAVGRGGTFTLRVTCPENRKARKCVSGLYLETAKGYRRTPHGLSRHIAVARRFVRIATGTTDRPLRFRMTERARALLKRDGGLAVTASDNNGNSPTRRFSLRLVPGSFPQRAGGAEIPGAAAAPTFLTGLPVVVTPRVPNTHSVVFIAWHVPEPMDNNGDGYRVRFTGPGGADCTKTATYNSGLTWNARYNRRYTHRRAMVGAAPRRSDAAQAGPSTGAQTWCRGPYRGSVVFQDYPRGLRRGTRHTSLSCSRQQVSSGHCVATERLVGRFWFVVR